MLRVSGSFEIGRSRTGEDISLIALNAAGPTEVSWRTEGLPIARLVASMSWAASSSPGSISSACRNSVIAPV